MIFVVDANLSSKWAAFLQAQGFTALYWPFTFVADALDLEIIAYATKANAIVLTQDLDFGMYLAELRLALPSVIQLRSADTNPELLGTLLLTAIREHRAALVHGALVTLDLRGTIRIRVANLPLS